jgi:hypothetical protein
MRGQAWPELELLGQAWGARRRGKRRGRGEGERGAAEGVP